MPDFIQQFLATIPASLGNLIGALLILLGGWLIALAVAAIVRGALRRTDIDNQLAKRIGGEEAALQIDTWISKSVYYVILLFAVVAFLQKLRLTAVTEPINALLEQIFAFIPQLIAAGVLVLVAWVIATLVRFGVSRLFKATNIDQRLSQGAGLEAGEQVPLSETLANVLYWFIFLLFLPAILGALNMGGLLGPVQGMLDEVLSYLPNLLGAGLILVIGWFVARIVRQIVTNLLTAVGADRLGARVGLGGADAGQTLSGLLGTIVYALILIPAIISALNALDIAAISVPATEMLQSLLSAVPNVFGAALVLGIAYFVARLVSDLVANVLTSVGFNKILGWIGLGRETAEGQRTPSEIVGYIVLLAIMLFAVSGASELLGFTTLVDLLEQFLAFAAQVALAVVIFGLGLYFANLARNIIQATAGAQSKLLAPAARIAIVIFAGALALRQTGIADDIVNLAFGLLLGAVAVAAAIAFGIGGRDIASRELEKIVSSVRGEN